MKYISIDIETLGLQPGKCDIVEFGAVIDDFVTPIDELPRFHCYMTKPGDIYKGEVYAMYMHSKSSIFERIAKREPGYSYIPDDLLDEVFFEWLQEQGFEEDEKVVVAGKNFNAFDLPFLKTIGFGTKTRLHHRTLDPGSMWVDLLKDDAPPGLEECLKRAGIRKTIEHTAVEDAMDVIRCIRAKQWNDVSHKRL
jgi:oligoribonuclease (3'-5' exoribonuclease)